MFYEVFIPYVRLYPLDLCLGDPLCLSDPWWNPSAEDQAVDRVDRAHKIGQTRPVTVSRLTVKDTVEDRILSLQVILSLMHLHYGVQIFFPA